MSLSPERYHQIGELFDAALELPVAARATFLTDACGQDAELRLAVEKLLQHEEDSGEGFLARPALDHAAKLLANSAYQIPEGELIGPYRIEGLLGAGGMGQVYLATDPRQARKVALKLLPPLLARDPENVRRLRREATALMALTHPNIVAVHEAGEMNGVPFLATEFVEGHTLRQRFAQGQLSLEEVLAIGIHTGRALAAAHDAGITHRDIKPENIILRPDGSVKVLDFGLASIAASVRLSMQSGNTDSATSPGTMLGTLNYMSPEQARGEKVDSRTDIYSFGVLLYELCAGKLPFAGRNMLAVLFGTKNIAPYLLANVAPATPAPLAELVHRCLASDREARPQTMPEILQEMQSFMRRAGLGLPLDSLDLSLGYGNVANGASGAE